VPDLRLVLMMWRFRSRVPDRRRPA